MVNLDSSYNFASDGGNVSFFYRLAMLGLCNSEGPLNSR